MPSESRQISESIDRPATEVYDYAADPAHLPEWAPGLGSSVENVDGRWFVEDMSSEDFERDAGLVQADLTRLKQVLEAAG